MASFVDAAAAGSSSEEEDGVRILRVQAAARAARAAAAARTEDSNGMEPGQGPAGGADKGRRQWRSGAGEQGDPPTQSLYW